MNARVLSLGLLWVLSACSPNTPQATDHPTVAPSLAATDAPELPAQEPLAGDTIDFSPDEERTFPILATDSDELWVSFEGTSARLVVGELAWSAGQGASLTLVRSPLPSRGWFGCYSERQ